MKTKPTIPTFELCTISDYTKFAKFEYSKDVFSESTYNSVTFSETHVDAFNSFSMILTSLGVEFSEENYKIALSSAYRFNIIFGDLYLLKYSKRLVYRRV